MNDPSLKQNIYTNPQARLDWVDYWIGMFSIRRGWSSIVSDKCQHS